jgi:hypothetical protein
VPSEAVLLGQIPVNALGAQPNSTLAVITSVGGSRWLFRPTLLPAVEMAVYFTIAFIAEGRNDFKRPLTPRNLFESI